MFRSASVAPSSPSFRPIPAFLLALALLPAGWFAPTPAGGAEPPAPVAGEADPDKRIQALELRIERLFEHVPPCGNMPDEVKWLQGGARHFEMAELKARIVEGRERVRLADGRPIPIELERLEISGRDSYAKVHSLLHGVSLRSRLIELEALTVKAEAGGRVSYSARLAYPCYAKLEEADEDAAVKALLGLSMPAMFAAREAELRATFARVSELTARSKAGRLPEALAAFDRLSADRPLALTELRGAEEIHLEGVVLPSPRSGDLAAPLAGAGFQVRSQERTPMGACERFSIVASLPPKEAPSAAGEATEEASDDAEDEPEVVLGNGLFDEMAAAVCNAAAEPALGRVAVRNTEGSAQKGAFTLHLRDVDVADLFLALHDLTGQSFLVDSGLRGRITVDVEGATLDQTLAELRGAGISVSAGPLHRVSRNATQAAASAKPMEGDPGEPIDVTLRGADLASFLCSLSNVLQRPLRFPRDLDEELTLFGTNLPVRRLLDEVLAAAGLAAVPEKDALVVIRKGSTAGTSRSAGMVACGEGGVETAAPSRLRAWLSAIRPLNELGAADLELAGLGRAGDTWKAYLLTPPSRRLRPLEPTQALGTARVQEIGAEGVVIAGEGSEVVHLRLRP